MAEFRRLIVAGRMPTGDVLASEIAEKDAFMRRKPWGAAAVNRS